MDVKYSLRLIPILGERESVLSFELRKAQSPCYLGCSSAHVLLELQHILLWLGEGYSVYLSLSRL